MNQANDARMFVPLPPTMAEMRSGAIPAFGRWTRSLGRASLGRVPSRVVLFLLSIGLAL